MEKTRAIIKIENTNGIYFQIKKEKSFNKFFCHYEIKKIKKYEIIRKFSRLLTSRKFLPITKFYFSYI